MSTIALNNPMVYIFPVIWFVAYKLINNFWLWLLFVPISLVIIRTIRSWYFKEDVSAHPFEQYEHNIRFNLDRDEDMEEMCLPIWENTYTRTSYFPSLITLTSHSCQSEVLFSENGKWKATITHNKWRFIPGLKVENEFTIRCERA
jgi:hypothetical protein